MAARSPTTTSRRRARCISCCVCAVASLSRRCASSPPSTTSRRRCEEAFKPATSAVYSADLPQVLRAPAATCDELPQEEVRTLERSAREEEAIEVIPQLFPLPSTLHSSPHLFLAFVEVKSNQIDCCVLVWDSPEICAVIHNWLEETSLLSQRNKTLLLQI